MKSLPFGDDNFWGQVLRGAAQGEGLVLLLVVLHERKLLGESEVDHLQVAVRVHEQILRLQISICNAYYVKMHAYIQTYKHVKDCRACVDR